MTKMYTTNIFTVTQAKKKSFIVKMQFLHRNYQSEVSKFSSEFN